jgi:hypothetical protein
VSTQNTPNEIVAWFETLDDVRAAQVQLERRGIDAVNIRVAQNSTVSDRRRADRRFGGWLGRRALIGAVLGAVIGALVGLGAGALLGAAGGALAAYAMAGAIFGVAPGFFYTVGTRLPASPDAFDTFGDEPEGDTWLAVSGTRDVQQQASEVLNELGPTRLVEA